MDATNSNVTDTVRNYTCVFPCALAKMSHVASTYLRDTSNGEEKNLMEEKTSSPYFFSSLSPFHATAKHMTMDSLQLVQNIPPSHTAV